MLQTCCQGMNKPHFFSLSPHQMNDAGHDFIYQRCVEQAVSPHVAVFKVFMRSDAKLSNRPDHWIPFFDSKYKWHGMPYRKILREHGTDNRRIFFCDGFSLLEGGHILFAFQFLSRSFDELWLILRYDFDSLKFCGKLHRAIIHILHRKLRKRLKLFTDSATLQQDLKKKLNLPIYLLPIPHTNIPIIYTKPSFSNKLRCYWPGLPRLAKGWDHIRRILTFNAPSQPHIEIVASRDAALNSSNIKTFALPSVLEYDQYWQEILNCDVLLLPYDPSFYRFSTSGIFVEGIVAGKIPVVHAKTWLADELNRFYLQDLIVDWEDPNFWQNIIRLAKDSTIAEKLSQMRYEYRSFHSLNNFAKYLVRMF
jgi:hypothetical protein